MAKLSGADAAARQQGRDALIAEAGTNDPNATAPSSAFLDVYADVLDATLAPLANSPDARTRLVVAVINARVAERAGNPRLEPLTETLLKDQNPGVVLWAVRASKFILPTALGPAGKPNHPLLQALAEAAKKSLSSPPIVQATYETLRVPEKIAGPAVPLGWSKTAIASTVPTIQGLFKQRVGLYVQGVPVSPACESSAIYVLTTSATWSAGNEESHLQTVQLLSDLLASISQRLDAASSSERTELFSLVQKCAGAIQVSGGATLNNDANLQKLYKVSISTRIADVQEWSKEVYPAMLKVPGWEKLAAPPVLPAAVTSTTAATQP